MSTETRTDADADLQALTLALIEGKPVDPAVAARVEERARKVQEELRGRFEGREIVVPMLREARDE